MIFAGDVFAENILQESGCLAATCHRAGATQGWHHLLNEGKNAEQDHRKQHVCNQRSLEERQGTRVALGNARCTEVSQASGIRDQEELNASQQRTERHCPWLPSRDEQMSDQDVQADAGVHDWHGPVQADEQVADEHRQHGHTDCGAPSGKACSCKQSDREDRGEVVRMW
jgi:hypothetical protein